MLVRLTKKLADVVNGIELSHCNEGDVIDLPIRHGRLLIAEGWAEEVSDDHVPNCSPVWRPNAREIAADRGLNEDPSVAAKLREYMSIATGAEAVAKNVAVAKKVGRSKE